MDYLKNDFLVLIEYIRYAFSLLKIFKARFIVRQGKMLKCYSFLTLV